MVGGFSGRPILSPHDEGTLMGEKDVRDAAARVRLACLDLDGTLLGSDKLVSAGNRAAIERAVAAGLSVAVASGRHPFNVCELLDELGLAHTAVCLSGGYVMLDGREVFRHGLSDVAVFQVIDVVEAAGCYMSLSGADFNLTAGSILRTGGETTATRRYVRCASYDELRAAAAERAGQILKAAAHADDPAVYEHLRAELRAVPSVTVAQSDICWSDVCAAGCSKAEGIAALAGAMGLDMSQVAAIGDDENDIESIGAVGLGVAVANAIEPVRRAARLVVADHDSDGVAEALDFIIECRKDGAR